MPPAAASLLALPATTIATMKAMTSADAHGSTGSARATKLFANRRARTPRITGSRTVLTMSSTMPPASMGR